mgnify:CR=1 FL=1
MDRRYRANLINSISGAKSANLIGTISEVGTSNVALFSSVFHLGADPALVGMLSRPNTVPRHTLENIRATGVYSINHVHSGMIQTAHLSSARSDGDKFKLTGLGEEFVDGFKAPFVRESFVKIGLSLEQVIDIELNGTHLIIGRVEHILIPNNCLLMDGDIDFSVLDSVAVTGLYTYHQLQQLEKLPYTKSDRGKERT